MSTPPSLPPVVKGRRDEFSGGRDILKAKGLKAAYAHFLSAGPPPAALNCDTELPGISAGFEIRQGRAMELAPLMEVRRSDTGYRTYNEADLRRAERIRNFIATGVSTREVRNMAACLSDEGAGPCEGGVPLLLEKLEKIDRMRADLAARRDVVLEQIAAYRASASAGRKMAS